MDAETILVAALVREQRRLDLTDKEMSERLQVSRPLWTRVRLGDYPMRRSAILLRGVIRSFPQFTSEALAFLRESPAAATEREGEQNDPEAEETNSSIA